jgi:hypothetical protein
MTACLRVALVLVLAVVGLGTTVVPARAADTVTVNGVVLGHDGQPVQGATVELVQGSDTDGCPEIDHGQYPVVLATTGADGRFSLTCTAGFLWVEAKLPSGEFAGWKTFGPGEHEFVFQAHAGRGSVTGTVYTSRGTPAAAADMMFIWDVPGAGAYDYFVTDAHGRYRVDGLFPGVQYTIVSPDDEFVFAATDATITHDFVLRADEPPGGSITGADGTGRLKVSGWAHDDVGVAKVTVAIRNRATGRWLRTNGNWGAYQRHPVRMTKPGEPRTGWWLTQRLRPGRYGVSLVITDSSGQRNGAPRPWRLITVRQ